MRDPSLRSIADFSAAITRHITVNPCIINRIEQEIVDLFLRLLSDGVLNDV
jgi:hypothetical protein